MSETHTDIFNGAASAAMLSAGIGSVTLGILTMLKASSETIRRILSFYPPTGPLSGQTTIAVAVWLITWLILHQLWKNRNRNFNKIYAIALILIILGLITTFPPLFEFFFESYE